MNAHADRAAAMVGMPYPPEPAFAYLGNWSDKIMCRTCYRTGYPGGRWMEPCRENPEHPHRCSCGRRFPSPGAIAAHVRACARWGYPDEHRRYEQAH